MRATRLQEIEADALALEIAVSDAPPCAEPEHEATVSRLPLPYPASHPATEPATEPVSLGVLDDVDEEDWLDGEHVLLESSDVIPVEAARSGAGLAQLIEADYQGHDPSQPLVEEPDEDLPPLAAFDAAAFVRPPEEVVAVAEPDPGDTIEDMLASGASGAFDPTPELETETETELEAETELASPDPLHVPLWSSVNTFAYALVRGLRGMGQSSLVQLLAVGTMAVCMLLLGTTMLIFTNASRVAHDLGIDTPVTVYMDPDADAATAAALRERIASLPEVERAERVTPEMALARLQEGVGPDSERAELLAGIDAGLLPDSVEVALVDGVEPGFADALATTVQDMDGVDEVAVLGPWVQQVESMLSTLRWLAFGVAALVSLACLAIVWSTIRLGVFARRSEIQILRLVGGTGRFVRGPFVIEGVVQGVLGTALALACLWLGFELIRPFLERGMSLMFAAGSLEFFSMLEMGLALGFGALLGLIGSRAAVARHAEA